jgi:hypothetical protein
MALACTPQDLVTAANCFYCQYPNLDSIEILLLCIMAGGTPPQEGTVFGNPEEEFVFGNPDADFVFGVPP